MKKAAYLFIFLVIFLVIFSKNKDSKSPEENTEFPKTAPKLYILKDVGEAYLPHFGLNDSDFENIRSAGFDIIEGNFDICASEKDVDYFLTQSNKNGLKVILNAGSGEAEWGYPCDEDFSPGQLPEWRRDLVIDWVNKWKGSSALFAWDISNEAGSVFPNSNLPGSSLRLDQIQKAYKDVKEADPNHPIMIRMNGWYFYDYTNDFFRPGNPFGKNTADIVMINAYSNVEDYYEDFVVTVTSRSIDSIREIDPNTQIIVSLGSWEELPLWYKPREGQIESEFNKLKAFDLAGIAFFKYGAATSSWYLPDHSELWTEISKMTSSTD